MKITMIIVFLLYSSAKIFAQNSTYTQSHQKKALTTQQEDSISNATKIGVTIGILQGGGSLLGFDYEIKVINGLAIQAGVGFFGFGGAINYHLNPGMRTSFLSLTYWHQGILATYTQSVLGPTFVYRSRKGFTFQIGMGKVLEVTTKLTDIIPDYPSVILLYSIGWYIPFN